MASPETRLGTFSALSIGIGGMVGGGIFAVTGLTIEVTRGAAPLAFVIAGIVALLTSYSYLRLTLRYPGEGGTVTFLNQAFGRGLFSSSANILLLFNYVVLVAVYAYAFGSYGAAFFPESERGFWLHTSITSIMVALLLINIFGTNLVIRSENFFNVSKIVLLLVFIAGGFFVPLDWERMTPEHFVTPVGLVAGAMLIFLNYEGFELIANASRDIENPRRALPVAYIGGVIIAMILYVLITIVVIGHLSFSEVTAVSSHSLSAAAQRFMGSTGFIIVAIAALLATSSAINATLYGTGRLTYIIAKTGELPVEMERSYRGEHLEGAILTALLAGLVANFVPLEAIATMGSAGFLLIFSAVNVANVRLDKGVVHKWVSALAAISTFLALVVLCIQVEENPATRNHLWILLGMIALSVAVELVYRRFRTPGGQR